MNLKENIKRIEKGEHDLLNNVDWIELRTKVFEINEIIWSLRHGNFDNYEEAMIELDELFSYKDYDCTGITQDEIY